MKINLVITLLLCSGILLGQEIIDFENFDLPRDTFSNGRDLSGGFQSGPFFLPNNYNVDFDAWLGWAISSMTDTLSPGFTNQYSCIAGEGVNSSAIYSVGYAFDPVVAHLRDTQSYHINGVMVNNATYPYLSMRDGDGFSKKFGGVTGDDPDYFLLTIKSYVDGQLSNDSVDFYLADFRAADSIEDYIINKWTFVDLSVLGIFDSLQFSLSSTDVGIFGMNTPAFFCLDDVSLSPAQSTSEQLNNMPENQAIIYPNPARNRLNIRQENVREFHLELYGSDGRLIDKQHVKGSQLSKDIEHLAKGSYWLKITGTTGLSQHKLLIKQ